jgi:hypothetical protein
MLAAGLWKGNQHTFSWQKNNRKAGGKTLAFFMRSRLT